MSAARNYKQVRDILQCIPVETMLLINPPASVTEQHVCVCVCDMHSHILWQVGRGGGQRRAMTLRCLLSEYHSVVLMRALDAWLTLVIGVISPHLQCRSRAMRRDVQKI